MTELRALSLADLLAMMMWQAIVTAALVVVLLGVGLRWLVDWIRREPLYVAAVKAADERQREIAKAGAAELLATRTIDRVRADNERIRMERAKLAELSKKREAELMAALKAGEATATELAEVRAEALAGNADLQHELARLRDRIANSGFGELQ